jgi:membrane associated rhomboid family serine protease
MGGLPAPGRALRGVLWTVGGLAIFWALVVNFTTAGREAFDLFTFSPHLIMRGQLWRFFTAGLLSPTGGPGSVQHVLFTLAGLYFLSPSLEARWGSAKFIKFLLQAVVAGYVLAFAVDAIPLDIHVLHTSEAFGLGAAITAIAVAWSREHADGVVRLFFILPVKGSMLIWLTIGWCILNVIFHDPSTEGLIAPFGGVAVGLLSGGSTYSLRTQYLRWKLAWLRRKTGGMTAASMLEGPALRRPGPSLRVIKGAKDDDPPHREPPKDKRYLN